MKGYPPVGTKMLIPSESYFYEILKYEVHLGYTHVRVRELEHGSTIVWKASDVLLDIPVTPLIEALC